MYSIKVFTNSAVIDGFNFKEGFVALVDGSGNILAATSGWECNGELFVYRPQNGGGWTGHWENEETFPVADVLSVIEEWRENEDLSKALAYAKGKRLYISDRPIRFTDVVPGEKSYNGGEYGFYTVYYPIPEHPGIYRVFTETTCDFDACGTGYEGIRALTVSEYRRLRRKSDNRGGGLPLLNISNCVRPVRAAGVMLAAHYYCPLL